MDTSFDIEFEKAVRILAEYMPASVAGSRKPILFHDIRVGVSLYQRGCSRDVVLAGVLHDIIEWSDMTEDMLREAFGEDILRIVLANSKDRSIEDKEERINDMMKRCVDVGEGALIVKAADTIDSFEHYTKMNNQDEIEHHCKPNGEAILRYKPESFRDPIFDDLSKWLR